MTFWKNEWHLGRQIRDVIVYDNVYPVVAPTSRLQEEITIAFREGIYMTIELFWEACFYIGKGVSGTQMPSAQDDSYAKVTYLQRVGAIS